MTKLLQFFLYVLTITPLLSGSEGVALEVFENDETKSLQGSRPAKKTDDPADLIKKGGGLIEIDKSIDSLKNVGQQEEDLTKALQQGDVGVVSSEAVRDSGAPPSTVINKTLPLVSSKSKPHSRLTLKNVPQMLKKYLITIPGLFNWWQYVKEPPFVPNDQ